MRQAASLAPPVPASAAAALSAGSARDALLADLKLFGLTYAAGFLVVSLVLA